MLPRLLALLCLVLWAQSFLSRQTGEATQDDVPDTCPVTRAGQTSLFVPPPPYPAKQPAGRFWFGTDRLWTSLPREPAWKFSHGDRTLTEKLFYWRQGYIVRLEPQPKLTVTGRRLDAPAPPLVAARASNGWVEQDQPFMVTAIDFPTVGCWEVTAHYKGDDLTFVVWVSK